MTTWEATRNVLSDSSLDRFRTDFKTFAMLKPPQFLHNLNTSGLGMKPGNIRKDLVEGASMVTEGLEKLRREFLAYKETNNQLHQATQLQLTATTSTLSALTNTVEKMGDRLVSTQRAVLFQSHEVSLSRALTDVKSNALSLRVSILQEADPVKRAEMVELLRSLQEEDDRLKADLAKTSHDFLAVVQGASVGKLVSAASETATQSTIAPPGLCRPADSVDSERSASAKKRRLHPPSQTGSSATLDRSPRGSMSIDDITGVQSQLPDKVRDYQWLHEQLTAADDDTSDASMMHVPSPRRCFGRAFYGVLDTLRDLNYCHRSRTFSCRSTLPNSNHALFLVALMFFLCLAELAHASAPPSSTATLSIYALNANGLVQPVKQHTINSIIKAKNPQAFVLGETKTKSKLGDSLLYDDYDIYEESGQQDETHHPVKWGIIVGIRKDIQVAQRLDIRQRSLKGRIIALDLVLPTSDGRCFPHRFVGVYAPWNPGDAGVSQSFWKDLTDVCRSTPHAWTIAGDLNATVSQLERSSGGAIARSQYLQFLADTDALDLWINYPDRSRRSDWTCRGHHSKGSIPEGSIIDRIATS